MIAAYPGVGRFLVPPSPVTPALPSGSAGRPCTLPFNGSVTPYENVNFDWVLANGQHRFYSYRTEELWPNLQPIQGALQRTGNDNVQGSTGGVCYNRWVRSLPCVVTLL
jgi:hypothetical protein